MTGRYLKATSTREKQQKHNNKNSKYFQTSLAKGGPSQTSLIPQIKKKTTLGVNKNKKKKDFQTSLAKGGPSQTSLIHKIKNTRGKKQNNKKHKDFQTSLAKGGPSQTSLIPKIKKKH